jgi:5'-3' exonuclease
MFKQIGSGSIKNHVDENLIRHMTLNILRSFSKKFSAKFGKMIICIDSKKMWRREVFPFYKINRKKEREKSNLDWSLIFTALNNIRKEIEEYLPYLVIEVEGAEADDIVAILARTYSNENNLIISSDKDFMQLQKYKNVSQYSPLLKKFIAISNPHEFLKTHILSGDKTDGIPNFLSRDNVFALGERQKKLTSKKIEECLYNDYSVFCKDAEMERAYIRNRQLIDFDYIPENLAQTILDNFKQLKPKGNKQKMLNYFISKNLKLLTESIDEF